MSTTLGLCVLAAIASSRCLEATTVPRKMSAAGPESDAARCRMSGAPSMSSGGGLRAGESAADYSRRPLPGDVPASRRGGAGCSLPAPGNECPSYRAPGVFDDGDAEEAVGAGDQDLARSAAHAPASAPRLGVTWANTSSRIPAGPQDVPVADGQRSSLSYRPVEEPEELSESDEEVEVALAEHRDILEALAGVARRALERESRPSALGSVPTTSRVHVRLL